MRTISTLHGKQVKVALLRATLDAVGPHAVVTIERVGDTARLLVQEPEHGDAGFPVEVNGRLAYMDALRSGVPLSDDEPAASFIDGPVDGVAATP